MSEIQKLMDEIYKFWNLDENKNLSKQELREVVPKVFSEKHLLALRIGDMNYQIEKGGFERWYDSGYADLDLDPTLDFLVELKEEEERESICEIFQILDKFSARIRDYEETLSESRKLSILSENNEVFEDCLLNQFYMWIWGLSEEYDEFKKQFLKDLEEVYFSK